jgi:hypothetical protein
MNNIEQHSLSAVAVYDKRNFTHLEDCAGGLVHLQTWIGSKPSQEDALYLYDSILGIVIIAVADGLGSHKGGKEAARICIEALHETIVTQGLSFDHQVLSRYIRLKMRKDPVIMADTEKPGGACMTIARIDTRAKQLDFYSIGDTQGLLLGKDNNVKFETTMDVKADSEGVTRAFSPSLNGLALSKSETLSIDSGDQIFCFTDGVEKESLMNAKSTNTSATISAMYKRKKAELKLKGQNKTNIDNTSIISLQIS